MKTSILTGEMAKLHHISKETLRYYHQIGLLVPDTIDEKGYRHYSLGQFAHLDSILFLRELGLSIQEIKDYFDHRNLDHMLHLLKEKRLSLDEELQCLKLRHTAITQKINLLETYTDYPYGVCTLKLLGKRYIAKLPLTSYDGLADFEYGLKALNHSILDTLNLFNGMIGVSLLPHHTTLDYFGKWDHVILVFEDSHQKNLDHLSSGNYATMTYTGTYEAGEPYYKKLLEWILSHHFIIDGDCLFLTISDAAFSSDPNDYITEIQIKVK